MATEDINVRYKLIADQALATLTKLEKQFDNVANGVTKVGKNTKSTNALLGQMSKNLGNSIKGFIAFRIGAALVRAFTSTLTAAVDASIRFEDALVGVGKTTNISGIELSNFGKEAEKLARRIPVASEELLKLSQIAGQLGVRGTENLLNFAETAARLARSTDLSAEAAITGLTRIIRLTGESDDNIDNLASSLVELGNNFNATESQILSAALALSQTTAGFNIGSDEVLGFATAIAEAGLGSEKAATAIGGVLTDITKSLSSSGKAAKNFARVTGLSLEEVTDIINNDAGKALDLFLGSLQDVAGDTVQLTKRLGELGVAEKRETQVIQSLVKLRETQTKALASSSLAAQQNTALIDESNRAFDTLSSSLTQASENTLQLTKALLEESGLATALKFTADQIALISGFWANYINGTTQADAANADLTARVKQLGKELGLTFENFDPAKIDQVTQANKALVAEFKAIDIQLKAIRSDETGFYSEQDLKNEEQRLVRLRERTVETAAELASLKLSSQTAKKEKSENNAIKDALDERRSILLAFQNASVVAADQAFEEFRISEELRNNAVFESLKASLGEEEAIRVAAQAQRKLNEAKTDDDIKKAKAQVAQDLINAEKKAAEARIKLDERTSAARLRTTAAFFNFAASIAKDGSKEQFIISKAGALAQAIVSKNLAVAQALAVPPSPNLPLAGLAETAGNFAIGSIIATAIKGFAGGGIVGGNSIRGDQVMAPVNSGEMILNRSQQISMFNQLNRPQGNSGQEIVVHSSVSIDGEEVGKTVSRQVANGLSLGDVV